MANDLRVRAGKRVGTPQFIQWAFGFIDVTHTARRAPGVPLRRTDDHKVRPSSSGS